MKTRRGVRKTFKTTSILSSDKIMWVLVRPATLQKHEDRKRLEKKKLFKKRYTEFWMHGTRRCDLFGNLGELRLQLKHGLVKGCDKIVPNVLKSTSCVSADPTLGQASPGLKLESPPASGTAGLMQTWDSRKCKLQEGPCVDQVCPRLPISMKKTLLTGLWEVDM